MTLADKIVVLRDGRIEQVGSPMDLYERPRNSFVAQFIGSPKMNFLAPGDLDPSAPEGLRGAGPDTIIGVRAEHLRPVEPGRGLLSARLELVEQLGEYALAHMLGLGSLEFIVKMEHPPDVARGATMSFAARPEHIHRFDGRTGLRRDRE